MADSQVFYRKWRPQTLSDVVGQEPVTQTLLNALKSGRIAHAYLFCGPRGTGKTSTGRILAKAVNCLSNGKGEPCNTCTQCSSTTDGRALDVIEIDAASNRGIDEIRQLRERVGYAPNAARYKVYIIDEVHMLTTEASNALLKTLEEPPAHAIFILATTEPHKVLPTIQSRCQRFDFRRLSIQAVVYRLKHICQGENITISPEALSLVARSATGSLRDAENLLEQLVVYYGHEITHHQVQALLGITGDRRVRELVKHILKRDIPAGLETLNGVMSDGLDLRQFLREMVEYLRALLLVKAGSEQGVELPQEDIEELRDLAKRTSLEEIAQAVRLFGGIDLRLDNYSPLPLELALVEYALPGAEKKEAAAPREKPLEASARPSAIPARAKAEATATPRQKPPEVSPSPPPPPQPTQAQATPEEKPAPVISPEAILAGPPDINYFRNRWKDFVNSLRGEGSSGNLDALLRSACEPQALEGNTLELVFFHSFHKEKMEDPKYRRLIERKLAQFFGSNYELRCVLKPGESKKIKESSAPPGPLVKFALEKGAKIVEVEEK